jgi:predicted nucleic acid-binding protein
LRALLDTSVLIGGEPLPPGIEASISAVSIAELHFGLLRAADEEARAVRAQRLGLIESRFPDPLPLDDRVARVWGRLQAAVASRGGQPRRRMADLAIAATAVVHEAVLITADSADLAIVADLVEVRVPPVAQPT